MGAVFDITAGTVCEQYDSRGLFLVFGGMRAMVLGTEIHRLILSVYVVDVATFTIAAMVTCTVSNGIM